MARRIVGWHGAAQELICDLCGNPATVIVEETDEDGWVRDFEACDACVPPGSCPDPIADVFVKLVEQIKAGKNHLVDSEGNLRPEIARQVGQAPPPLPA